MDNDDDKKGKRPHGRMGGEKSGDRGGEKRFEKRAPKRFDRDERGGDKPRRAAPRVIEGEEDDAERIAKRLARAGIASRREAETMIAAGRIAVNGKVLDSPAVNVKRADVITVDGKKLRQAERTRLWLYHKPAGLVTTNRDPEGRPTVFDALPPELPRVLSVGRLDINTEGLLLLTNDGGLSRVLELPSTGWLRRYRVRAHGKVTQQQLDELKNGIAVDGVFYGGVEAELEREQGSNVWLSLGLREGKNREVKNILGALGLTVGRLIRISFGPFQLGDLEEGAVREIKGRTLRDQLGEKLVEDSGADFDAPILNEFSNTAVKGLTARDMEATPEEQPAERRREPREREWISSTPERRKRRDDKGDQAEAPRRRAGGANVWMAPGARPKGEKAAAKAASKPARVEHQQPHRAAKWSGDMQLRPRRAEGEEGGERRGSAERSEQRFDRRPGEGREERPQQRRPGKRERAELREGGERPQGGFEGRKFGKPAGERREGSYKGPKSGAPKGFGKGSDKGPRGPRGDGPNKGMNKGPGKGPRGGRPGGGGADRRR